MPVGTDLLHRDGLESQLVRGRVGPQAVVIVVRIDEQRIGHDRIAVKAALAPLLPRLFFRYVFGTGLVDRDRLAVVPDQVVVRRVLAVVGIGRAAVELGVGPAVGNHVAAELVADHAPGRFRVHRGDGRILGVGRIVLVLLEGCLVLLDQPLVVLGVVARHDELPLGAVHDDVVFDQIVAPGVNVDASAGNARHDVAVDLRPAVVVVEIDAEGEEAGDPIALPASVAEDVVHEVVAHDVAAHMPVASGVESGRVFGHQVVVADVVVFHHAVVSATEDAGTRDVMDQVVGDAQAHAVQAHAVAVAVEHADVVQVVVVGVVGARSERFAVAAAERDARVAHFIDIVADHAAGAAAVDIHTAAARHAPPARVADRVCGDQAVLRAAEQHGVAVAALHGKSAERDPGGLGADFDQVVHDGRKDLGPGHRLGGPEVEHARVAVQVPFAARIEFLEQVAHVVAIAWSDPARVAFVCLDVACERDQTLLGIEGGDAHADVHPVMPGKIDHLARLGMCPHTRIARLAADLARRVLDVLLVLERVAGNLAVDIGIAAGVGVRGIEVRVACQRHALAVEEQLAKGVLEAQGADVRLEDRILVPGEAGDLAAAAEHRLFVLVGAIHDRRSLGAGVLGGQLERLAQLVGAATHPDGDAAGGQAALVLQLADPVTRRVERRQRLLQGAGRGVVAAGGDIELRGRGEAGQPQRHRQDTGSQEPNHASSACRSHAFFSCRA